MNKKSKLILRLLGCSWMKPTLWNGFREWCDENEEELAEEVCNGDYETDDEWKDDLYDFIEDDDNKLCLLLAFLLDKEIIQDSVIKSMFKGVEFGNNCYGNWRDEASKLYGVKFQGGCFR